MPTDIFLPAAQLGGTVFTVVAFLWYLSKLLKVQIDRDDKASISQNRQADSNITLATSLQKLSDLVGKNTRAVEENKPAVEGNTEAVDENTKVISKNGNGK